MKDYYLIERRNSPYVYVRFREGDRIGNAVSSRCTSRTAAIRWANAELEKRESRRQSRDLSLGEYAAPFFGPSCPYLTRRRDEGRTFSVEYIRNSRNYVERFILPDPIARIKLADLRRRDVLAWRKRLLDTLGPRRMIWHILGALKLILNEAVYEELLDASPASRVANPTYPRKERTAITLDALRALLDPGLYEDPRHWMATVCVAYTGMRAGEVCALAWDAVDFKRGTIRVFRAVKDKGARIGPPKSGKDRIVPMTLTLSKMLSEWKPRSKGEWVFGYSEKRLMGYSHWSVAVAKAAKKAGCPGATLHVLRHTLNSHLRGQVSDVKLQASFGWSGVAIQNAYSHAEVYDYSEQTRAIDALIGGHGGTG